MKKSKNLIWIDLEMTGLNPQVDRIIEIALVVTDSELNILAEAPVFAIHQSDEQLAKMDAWNVKHHTASGLVQRVKDSTVTEAMAETALLEFLNKWVKKGASPMCGNTIWQDRRFLSCYMPQLEQYFHYRLLDVSTFKECAKRWEPAIYKGFKKQSKHQALLDIQESIEELQYYRKSWLTAPSNVAPPAQ
jgi:oligoribonuclease